MTVLNESQRTFASAHGIVNPTNIDSIAGMSAKHRLEIANRANDPDAPKPPVSETTAQAGYRQQFNLDEDLTGADGAHRFMYQQLGELSFANTSESSAPSEQDPTSESAVLPSPTSALDAPVNRCTARLDADRLVGESAQYRVLVANALETLKRLGMDAVPETDRLLVEKNIKR